MSFLEIVKNLTPEVYESLKQSLQLGRWPDGRQLSAEQKEICMEAIIAYEAANDVPEEQRVGYISRDRPTPCSSDKGDAPASGIWTPGNTTKH